MCRTLLPGCHERPWLAELSNGYGNEASDDRGRVRVYLGTSHRFANTGGWQYRYRLVVAYAIGSLPRKDEHVHHADGVVYHDVPENLSLELAEYHGRLHAYLLTLADGRGPDGRFKSIQNVDYPPVLSPRYRAIISERRIDELQGPERRVCEAGCEICKAGF